MGAAETTTEDWFFSNNDAEVNEIEAFLLQEEQTEEELFSELVEDVNKEDGEIALRITRVSEDGETDVIIEEAAIQELTDENLGRQVREETINFPSTTLEPTDSVYIEVLAAFEGELELLTENEVAEFTTEQLNAVEIPEHEANMVYDLEFDDGQGGQNEGEIRFFWGGEDSESQIEDFTYEAVPPEINLIDPDDEEVFSSGEEIEFAIEDEYRDLEDVYYNLDGERQEFDSQDDEIFIADTTDWEEGEREVEVVAENEDGATTEESYTFTVDDTPPDVDIIEPEEEPTNEEEIEVIYEAEDENEIVREEFTLNDGDREDISSGDIIELEEDGEYDLTIYAEDEAGNEGEDTVTFTLDTEDPELEIIEPENITYDTFEVPLEVEANIEEDEVTYEVFDQDNNQIKEEELEEEQTTLEFEERDTYTIELTAEDDAGNTKTLQETFTVDPEPAIFETNITDTNSPIQENEELEVDVQIQNTGDLEDTREIEFFFDNREEPEESREITLSSEEITTEQFTYDSSEEETGEYDVEIISGEESEESDQQEILIGLPELQLNNIAILDVTEEQNKRDDGELIAEDLETLEIEQTERNKQYRFEFTIENIGENKYQVEKSDLISHIGVNNDWQLEDIYLRTEEDTFEGGEKTEDTLEWDKVDAEIPEDTEATFEYIIETDTTESQTYEAQFNIESDEQEINLENAHNIEKTKYGFIETQLLEPPEEFTASEDSTFTMTAETVCQEGDCGEIDKTSRYNETGDEPNAPIPEEQSEPVYTTDSNPEECNGELTHEETCEIEWSVEVTGDTETSVSIDVLTESSLDEVEEDTSETSTFTIQDSLILDVEFDQIDFGTVSPGRDEQPATENTLGYNVTVPGESLDAEEIRVSGTLLNNSLNDGYSIAADNIGYSLEDDVTTKSELSEEKQLLAESVSAGTTLQTYYWLDIPTGITADTYRGVIEFEATQ